MCVIWLFAYFNSVCMQVTSKPIVVYPNSGECYDGIKKEWIVSYYIPQLCTFEVITCFVP